SLLDILQKRIDSDKFTVIFTPNPEQVVQSQKNKQFLVLLQKADILIPDGIGLVWASRLLSMDKKTKKIETRIAGRELVEDLLDIAKNEKLKVLVVGGRGYKKLEIKNPKYQNIYFLESYKNFDKASKEEEDLVIKTIRDVRPDVIFVALGAPKQEYWVDSHRTLLEKTGVRIAMVVGGSFDYLVGSVPKTPKLLSNLGLEWLFRLVIQPWRWKRQLRLIEYLKLVFIEVFKKKTRKSARTRV
ncbi:MAG: WecB/TagA/CpsF family glycosyltransferase, partial [Patescibacteria group bacterium]